MISCENITKTYITGAIETLVLKGISLKIDNGEFTAIIGPSGSGKSTLMHILGLLDTSTSGKYILDGTDVSRYSDDQLAEIRKNKIGFVFQQFNLLPRTTVLNNVELPLIYAGVPKKERTKRAIEALNHAGLDEQYYTHYSNQLSGGQMQRVAIARALVNNPSIIFADEPTGNLDTKTGEIVLHTFQELNQKLQRTIVLITHENDVAAAADRIIALRDGLIVADNSNPNKRNLTQI